MGYGGVINTIADPFGIGNTGSPATPNPRRVGSDYSSLIAAYLASQPAIFASESMFKPQYTALDLNNLSTVLNGGNGAPGVVDDMIGANSRMRTANLADFQRLSPDAIKTYRSINPGGGALLTKLTDQASAGLDAGSRLTPEQLSTLDDTVRGAQGARGVSYGPASAYSEILANSQFGQDQLTKRQQFAGNVLNMNEADTNQIFQSIAPLIGGDSQAPAFAQAVASGSGPTLMPGNQSYDLFNTAYNARSASNIAGANNAAAENSY
jgi:hypothetical protein